MGSARDTSTIDLEARGHWWVTTDLLENGGKRIVGPFDTFDLAAQVRVYVEMARGPDHVLDRQRRGGRE